MTAFHFQGLRSSRTATRNSSSRLWAAFESISKCQILTANNRTTATQKGKLSPGSCTATIAFARGRGCWLRMPTPRATDDKLMCTFVFCCWWNWRRRRGEEGEGGYIYTWHLCTSAQPKKFLSFWLRWMRNSGCCNGTGHCKRLYCFRARDTTHSSE